MLLGLGLPITFGLLSSEDTAYEIDVEKMSNTLLIAFTFLIVTLILTLVIVPCSKFQLSKWFAIVIFFIYIAFTTVSILAETGVILKDVNLWKIWNP